MKSALKQKRRFELPHPYLILMTVMLLVVVLSWIIPSGEYTRVANEATGYSEVVSGSFHFVEQDNPITFLGFFTSINAGITAAMAVGSLILVMTGAIAILDSTEAMTTGVKVLIQHAKGKEFLMIVIFLFFFTLLGAAGMAENLIPFIPIMITLVIGLGYDRLVGISLVIMSIGLGWTGGIVNVYTTGLAQQMIGLPIFSGIGLRVIAQIIFFLVAVGYLYFYCRKIKADPTKSVVAQEYITSCNEEEEILHETVRLTGRMKAGLNIFFIALVVQTYGAVKLMWNYNQMSAIFLVAAIAIAIAGGINMNKACRLFTKGAADLLQVVFLMGLAQAVTSLMKQAKMLDTLVYYISQMLTDQGMLITLLAIYLIVIFMNFFIISGEGKAVVLVPILSPLGQVLHINQQVLVLAYQYGDGFTNMLYPTSGSLHAMLAVGNVTYGQWVKFSWKLWTLLSAVAFGIILVAQLMNYGPF